MFASSERGRLAAVAAVVLAGLGAGLAADRYLAHGWTADWWATVDGARVRVARTVEHRARFPNGRRPLARYAQGWDFPRLGVPGDVPPLDATLRADLVVPPGRARALEVAGEGEATLLVDGAEASAPAAPGRHRIEVRWTGRLKRPRDRDPIGPKAPVASLVLRWDGEAVPAASLTPIDGTGARRAGAWLAVLLLTGLLAAGAHRALGTPPGRRRARRLDVVVGAAIVVLGVGLRLVDYDVMPDLRENGDELFATWNGWQLLATGETVGWSLWPGFYRGAVDVEPVRYFRDEPWHLVRPYFEHPPLLHALVGAAAHLGGADHFLHAKLKHTRLVPIALAGATLALLLLVGRRLQPTGPGPHLAALLWAVLPNVVLQTRVIKEEALLTPMMLLVAWLFLRWREDESRRRALWVAAGIAGLSALAKVSGVVLVPALVALVLGRGRDRWRLAGVVAAIGLAAASLLLVYGAAIDWGAFWLTTVKQATGRPSHFNLFPRFFDDPLVNHNLVGRGWLLFLWAGYLATVAGAGRRADPVYVVLPLVYLVGIGLSSGNWTFGWYVTPILPFLCLGAGRFLADAWERPDFLRGFLFVGLGVMYTLNFTLGHGYAKSPGSWPEIRRTVALVVVGLMGPFGLAQAFDAPWARRVARGALAVGLAVLVALSAVFVARYDVFYDRYRNYDRDAYYDR